MLLSIHQQQTPTCPDVSGDLATLLVDFITTVAKVQATNFFATAEAIKQIDGFDNSDYAMSNSTMWVNFDSDGTMLTNQLTYTASAKIGIFLRRKAGAVYCTLVGLQKGKNGVVQTNLTPSTCIAEDKFDGYCLDSLEDVCRNAGLNMVYSLAKYC